MLKTLQNSQYNRFQKKYNNKYLVITGAKKVKASYFFKILSFLFKIPKKKIIYLKIKVIMILNLHFLSPDQEKY